MRIIKDASSRAIAMENGEVLLATFEETPRELARMKKKDHLVVTDQGYAAIGPIVWLAFNHQRAPTSDPAVRKAIAYAVDRDFLINALLLGAPPRRAPAFTPGACSTSRTSSPMTSTSTRPTSSSTTRGTRAAMTACASSCSSTSGGRP